MRELEERKKSQGEEVGRGRDQLKLEYIPLEVSYIFKMKHNYQATALCSVQLQG